MPMSHSQRADYLCIKLNLEEVFAATGVGWLRQQRSVAILIGWQVEGVPVACERFSSTR